MSKTLAVMALGTLASGAFGGVVVLLVVQHKATIRAERFIVRDSAGWDVAELGLAEGDVGRLRLSRGGVEYVEIRGGPRPTLRMRDDGGNIRAELSLRGTAGGNADEPQLVLHDSEGRDRVAARVLADGRPSIDFYDASGRHRIALRVERTGVGHLEIFDDSGKAGLSVAVHQSSHSEFAVYDEAHTKRLVVGLAGGAPAILVAREPGATLVPLLKTDDEPGD